MARDLVSPIQMWDYATETATGCRLTGNSADFADVAYACQFVPVYESVEGWHPARRVS